MACIIEGKDRSGSKAVFDRQKGLLRNSTPCPVVLGAQEISSWFGELSYMGLEFAQLINHSKEPSQF